MKQCLRQWAVASLSSQYADKLTKDLNKSLLRKVSRCDSRFTVCRKVFFTSLWAYSCYYLSVFVYEATIEPVLASYYPIFEVNKEKEKNSSSGSIAVQRVMKFANTFICTFMRWISGSVGFATGALISTNLFPTAGELVFQSVSDIIFKDFTSIFY